MSQKINNEYYCKMRKFIKYDIECSNSQKAYISPQKPLSAAKSPLKPWNPSPKIGQTSPAVLRAQMSPRNLGIDLSCYMFLILFLLNLKV